MYIQYTVLAFYPSEAVYNPWVMSASQVMRKVLRDTRCTHTSCGIWRKCVGMHGKQQCRLLGVEHLSRPMRKKTTSRRLPHHSKDWVSSLSTDQGDERGITSLPDESPTPHTHSKQSEKQISGKTDGCKACTGHGKHHSVGSSVVKAQQTDSPRLVI